jgi:hypothetical protein
MCIYIDSLQELDQEADRENGQQPDIDWRNAPAGARWWSVTQDGKAYWHIMAVCEPVMAFLCAVTWPAPTFGYAGDWRESLAERPETELASSIHCLLRSAG